MAQDTRRDTYVKALSDIKGLYDNFFITLDERKRLESETARQFFESDLDAAGPNISKIAQAVGMEILIRMEKTSDEINRLWEKRAGRKPGQVEAPGAQPLTASQVTWAGIMDELRIQFLFLENITNIARPILEAANLKLFDVLRPIVGTNVAAGVSAAALAAEDVSVGAAIGAGGATVQRGAVRGAATGAGVLSNIFNKVQKGLQKIVGTLPKEKLTVEETRRVAPKVQETLDQVLGRELTTEEKELAERSIRVLRDFAETKGQTATVEALSIGRMAPTTEAMKVTLETRGIDTAKLPRLPGESLEEAIRNKFTAMGLMAKESKSPRNILENFKKELEIQRRGVRTKEMQQAEAGRILDADPNFIEVIKGLTPGTTMEDAHIVAAINVLDEPIQSFVRLSRILKGGDESILPVMEQAFIDMALGAKGVLGVEAEAGRTLATVSQGELFREFSGRIASQFPKELSEGGFVAAEKAFFKEFANIPLPGEAPKPTVKEIGRRFVTHFIQDSFDFGREVWNNILLARPLTQVRNAVGTSMGVQSQAIRLRLAPLLGEGAVKADDYIIFSQAMNRNAVKYLEDFKGILDEPKFIEILGTRDPGRIETFKRSVGGALGEVLRTPGRGVMTLDIYAQNVVRESWIELFAHRAAKQAGLNEGTDDFVRFVSNNIAFPSKAAFSEAKRLSQEATYTEPFIGPINKAVQMFQNSGGYLVLPFVRTPIRLAQWEARNTPGLNAFSLKLNRALLNEGSIESDIATSQIALSYFFGTLMWNWVNTGYVTGGGPADHKMRELWEGAGNQPYTIRDPITGKTVLQYRNFEPLGGILGAFADLNESSGYLEGEKFDKAITGVQLALTRMVTNNLFLRLVTDFGRVIEASTQGEAAKGLIEQIGTDILTTIRSGGPLGQSLAGYFDDVRREAVDFNEETLRNAGWFAPTAGAGSVLLNPDYDSFGRPKLRPRSSTGQTLENFRFIAGRSGIGSGQPDSVYKELYRLRHFLGDLPESVFGGKRPISSTATTAPEESFGVVLNKGERVVLAGMMETFRMDLNDLMPELPRKKRTAYEATDDFMQSEAYSKMSDPQRRKALDGIYGGYLEAAVGNLTITQPRIQEELIRAEASAARPLLTTDPDALQQLDAEVARVREMIDRGMFD